MKISFKSKYIKILIICLGIFILYSINGKSNEFPKNIPVVKININDKKYNTTTGEGTWFDKKFGGRNSFILNIKEKFDEIQFIEVNSNEKIIFDISYLENIQETTLYSIDFSEITLGERIKILNNIYEFNAQKDKGEYYYSFNIKWDDTHNFEYLFKIKVI